MTSDSGGEHPDDISWGPPDAHVTVKYLTPKSSFTPECKGGRIQEKKGVCIIRMWYKKRKDPVYYGCGIKDIRM